MWGRGSERQGPPVPSRIRPHCSLGFAHLLPGCCHALPQQLSPPSITHCGLFDLLHWTVVLFERKGRVFLALRKAGALGRLTR